MLDGAKQMIYNHNNNGNERKINMVTDEIIERRFRYRLNKHGMKLHKEVNAWGKPWYYITDEDDQERPDDDDQNRWLSFSEVESFVEKLAQEDAEYQAEQRLKRKESKF